MITGYYITGTSVDSTDWALVEQDGCYDGSAAASNLTYEAAVALYWRKIADLAAARPVANNRPDPERNSAQQLALKL